MTSSVRTIFFWIETMLICRSCFSNINSVCEKCFVVVPESSCGEHSILISYHAKRLETIEWNRNGSLRLQVMKCCRCTTIFPISIVSFYKTITNTKWWNLLWIWVWLQHCYTLRCAELFQCFNILPLNQINFHVLYTNWTFIMFL